MRFILPFETKTKAEMLQDIKSIEGLAKWAQESRSCVHTSLRQMGKTHCGHCPACIERRQAFAAAGIEENMDIYQTNAFTESLPDQDEADYLNMYQLEAMKWIEGAESGRRRMSDHLRLTDVPEEHDEKIIELQSRHSREILATFGSPFLNRNKAGANPLPENAAIGNGMSP